jgi:tripartite-type tricarboxylate transporter receptor subunit TctC
VVKCCFQFTGRAALLALALLTGACSPTASPAPTGPAAKPEVLPPPVAPAAQPAAQTDARAIEDFYKGKTIRIVVGSSPGGGLDTYTRLIARHLSKYVPGAPTIIVENMPGADTLVAANTVYNNAPKDGTTIVHFLGGMFVQQLIGNPGVQVDLSKYLLLAAPTPDTLACAVMQTSGFNRLDEATGSRELILGGTAPGSQTEDVPNVMKKVLGLNIRLITGYPGTSQIRLAAESGEVMGGCWAWETIKPTWREGLASGQVKIIAQGGRTAHRDLPNVPLIRDLARNDEQRQLIDAGVTLPTEFNRPFAVPPGVPAERVQALREGFAATFTDPELLAEAERAQLEINPFTGEQLEKSVAELFALPADIKAKLKEVLTP